MKPPFDKSSKRLDLLLSGVDYELRADKELPKIDIRSVSDDSRRVDESSLFVAIAGTRTDGHNFINQVLEAGCRVIIIEKGRVTQQLSFLEESCIISVEDSRKTYGQIAAAFYDYPAKKLKMIGITGTNGKTSVTYLLENVLGSQSCRVGVIGTVNYRYIDEENNRVEVPAPLTTPDPLMLNDLLARMVQSGIEYVVMEVSSHALHQRRIEGITFDVGAFTNLSHDHLDYHQDMESYFQSKLLLFSYYLKPGGKVAVCTGVQRPQEKWSSRIIELCKNLGITCLDCGDDKGAVQLIDCKCHLEQTSMIIEVAQKRFELNSCLVGRFNIENLLTAYALGVAAGVEDSNIVTGLEKVTGVPGRLQRVKGYEDDTTQPVVFVDYAHTPDALEKVLIALSELPHKSIYTVFGCGGDRDQEKRSLMGEVAGRYSNFVIVTNDNPRTESPEKIVTQIRSGIEKSSLEFSYNQWLEGKKPAAGGFLVVYERERAIRIAVTHAQKDDIVLIAGKGHEKYQLFQQTKRFFDDCLEVRNNLCSWTISKVLQAVNGQIGESVDKYLGQVSIDSRTIEQGDIFVALIGENFNGHIFIKQAVSRGCGCLVVSEPVSADKTNGVVQIIVDDTLKALGDLTAYRRKVFASLSNPTVIGITGSCGKTTVKEMVATILQRKWPDGEDVPKGRVRKTEGNYNNLVGLPLSLLPINAKEKSVVLEMGMNRPGEIERLTQISDPDIACITNVHPAHLLGLHTIEGVAQAKEELFAGCRQDTNLVVNLDDPYISEFAKKYDQKKTCFSATEEGVKQGAQVWASHASLNENGCAQFTLHVYEQSVDIVLQIAGLHNVTNSLAAAAIAHLAGATIDNIVTGLQNIVSVDKRMETIVSKKGCSILNDTYNANPASMKAGLITLSQINSGKKVAILGDMLELGTISESAHFQIGCFAAKQGLDQLIVVGDFAEEVSKGALSCGMEKAKIAAFSRKDELADWLENSGLINNLGKNDWLLVKGSRGMKLENIVELFINE